MMASRSLLTLLLFILHGRYLPSDGFTVDPPENLKVLDPGHLGPLQITWSPPISLINMTDCQRWYQLEYFDTYSDSWSAVRTKKNTYSTKFNLMKDVRVRVYTLLCGPCVNGTMIQSTNYTELVQKPSSVGAVGTEAQDFVCVYYNRRYLECTWERSAKMSANLQHNLYFWHKGLDHAVECPKYIIWSGDRRGCNFTGLSLPIFTDINICVNGSSPEGPVRSKFISLQIQNHVKPEATETLHLQAVSDMQLELRWDGPVGRVPTHCLEWEVEHSREGPDGKVASKQIFTKQTNLTVPSRSYSACFRVRSRLHKYCADKSFWSDWSSAVCHQAEEKREVMARSDQDMTIYVYMAATILPILLLLLLLCLVTVAKERLRQEKKPDSPLTTPFSRNSVFTMAEA